MKRLLLVAFIALGIAAASVALSPQADAGLFGGHAKPTPSASPSALPTASPEPPTVAIPLLQAKLKANPNDQEAMVELAGQFLNINRPDLTVQLTQRLLQLGDKTGQVYYLDGYAQNALNNTKVAIADLQEASDLDPTNLGVLGLLSSLYITTHQGPLAEKIAQRAITFNKTSPSAYEALGAVYTAEGKFDDARAQFEKAVALDPKSAQPLLSIARTYGGQNNIPLALTAIARAIAVSPQDVQLLTFKAQLYASQHDDANTAAAYDDAIVAATTDDQKIGLMVQKAAYFSSEKKPQQSAAIFQQILAQYPKSPQAHDAYGDYFAAQKNITQAQAQWQAALAIDANDTSALLALGQTAMTQNNITNAIGYLKRLTTVAPDPSGYALLGQAYSYAHDYGNSRDACGKSFQLQRTPDMLVCIAAADYQLHDYKEAAQIFDVLAARAPQALTQEPQLLLYAGKSYQQTNQRAKALSAYKRVLPLAKKNTKLYHEIAQAIADLNHPQPVKKKH